MNAAQIKRNLNMINHALVYARNAAHGMNFRQGAFLINRNRIQNKFSIMTPNLQRRSRNARARIINALGRNYNTVTRSNWSPSANARLVARDPRAAKANFNRRKSRGGGRTAYGASVVHFGRSIAAH
jgi:hypothetical protein